MKSGWKTSEFWLALAGKAVGLWQLAKATSPWAQLAGGLVAAVSGGGYSLSRAKAKAAAEAAIKAGIDSIAQKK
jgi:hypothetical protein